MLYSLSEFHSGSGSVGTTAQPLATGRRVYRHVIVKADPANTAAILVGPHTLRDSGFKLAAGDEVIIPIDAAAKIYVVAESDTQNFSWVAA